MVSVPTQGEEFSKFIHHLDSLEDSAYKLSHLARAMGDSSRDRGIADGWFAVGELLKRMRWQVTQLAQGKLQ